MMECSLKYILGVKQLFSVGGATSIRCTVWQKDWQAGWTENLPISKSDMRYADCISEIRTWQKISA